MRILLSTEKGTSYEVLMDEHEAVYMATDLLDTARLIVQHWRDSLKKVSRV